MRSTHKARPDPEGSLDPESSPQFKPCSNEPHNPAIPLNYPCGLIKEYSLTTKILYTPSMLRRIKINRFKSIRSQELTLGRVNLFIGGNGSGKSNFLREAIGIASAALGRSLGDADIEDKGIRLSPPELMKSAHKNADTPKTLDLSCSFDSGVDYRCNLTSRENNPLLRFHSESYLFEKRHRLWKKWKWRWRLWDVVSKRSWIKNRGMWDQIRVAYNFEDAVFDTLDAFSEYKIYSPHLIRPETQPA